MSVSFSGKFCLKELKKEMGSTDHSQKEKEEKDMQDVNLEEDVFVCI